MNIEETLLAILAEVDGIQGRLERVVNAVDDARDTVEATRISLGALREVVRNDKS